MDPAIVPQRTPRVNGLPATRVDKPPGKRFPAIRSLDGAAESPTGMFADRGYGDIDLAKLTVGGHGYRWICLRRKFSL